MLTGRLRLRITQTNRSRIQTRPLGQTARAFLASLLLGSLFLGSSCNERKDGEILYDDDLHVVGKLGRQPGQFSKPRAVAVTPENEIVIIDRTGRIILYDLETLEFLRQWRLNAWDNGTPTGVSIDPIDGDIWVADTHYQQILKYTPEGELVFKFGEAGEDPGQFIFPTDITADPDGKTLWVTEYGRRSRIMKFTRQGEFIEEWGSELYESLELERPMAISLSSDAQELYVVDTGNHRINIYDRNGKIKRQFGELGSAKGQMKYPLDLSVAPDGTFYIIEYENSRLSRYSPDGEFLGNWGGPGNGAGEFFLPWGCAVGEDGSLVIADTNNHRIQILRNPEEYFTSEMQLASINNKDEETRKP